MVIKIIYFTLQNLKSTLKSTVSLHNRAANSITFIRILVGNGKLLFKNNKLQYLLLY